MSADSPYRTVNALMDVGEAFYDCFTVVDATTSERPCLYVNSVFTEHTGYTPEDAVGKNLDFLQGDLTDTSAIRFMRDSFMEKAACCVDLINYRKDASSFWNRLVMLPIESADRLFYLGFQNVLKNKVGDAVVPNLSSDGEINHVLNNKLSSIVLNLEIALAENLDIESAMQSCQQIFKDINDFCMNIESPGRFGDYNPFAATG